MVITPGKNFDGQKGFPTPSDIPSDTACRSFILPDNDEWLGLLMGAAELLLNPHNYFNYGALSIDDTVDKWQEIIQDAYDRSLLGTCAPAVSAPYWDTYGDSDDEASVEDQPWYGELVPIAAARVSLLEDDELTWKENLGIWAIAGFIAYSGQIGAAIAFVPFAQRFVLKFRGNPLGAIAEIFVDGAKLTALDTASAEDRIKAIDIQLPDDDEEHEIWVAVGEDSPPGTTLQVVRKELDPSEVYPTNLRYNSDCDCVQQTYDGGETWVDQPGQDPRHSETFLYPPVVADDPKCQAAANQVRFLNDVIDEALGAIALGTDVLGIGTTLLPLFVELGPFAILFDLVLGLASGLASAGSTAINAAFTNEVYDQLTCIFYCEIEDDGSVTFDDAVAIQLKVNSQIGGLVSVIIDLMIALTGEVGLSNEGTIGEAPADCSECECGWCMDFNFLTTTGGNDGDFTVISGEGGNFNISWEGTNLNSGNKRDLGIERTFTPTEITYISMDYHKYPNGSGPNNSHGMRLWSAGSLVYNGLTSGNGTGFDEHSFSTPILADKWQIFVNAGDSGNDVDCQHAHIEGIGDNPLGVDNC